MAWDSDYRYEPSPLFEQTFQCLPFSRYTNPDLESGDKIIMPASALAQIIDLQLANPFLFKIEGFQSDKISHCGVLQFDAEEGFVYMPEWMMKNMSLQEEAYVILRDARLSRGVYMKLQPHSTSFINVTNPRSVLEKTMREFTCLSLGDTFMIKYFDKDFYFDVLKVVPGDAIILIDTDCELDLAPPLDYVEPETEEQEIIKAVKKQEEGKMLGPFVGKARRLDGGGCSAVVKVVAEEEERKTHKKDGGREEGKELFKPFTGRGRVLRG